MGLGSKLLQCKEISYEETKLEYKKKKKTFFNFDFKGMVRDQNDKFRKSKTF